MKFTKKTLFTIFYSFYGLINLTAIILIVFLYYNIYNLIERVNMVAKIQNNTVSETVDADRLNRIVKKTQIKKTNCELNPKLASPFKATPEPEVVQASSTVDTLNSSSTASSTP